MQFQMPFTFIRARSTLTWREVEFGLQHGWLTDDDAIELAIDRVSAGDRSPDVLDLASVLRHEKYRAPDFDYPKEIAGFVRYMPPEDPSRAGESHLLDAWRRYLNAAARNYGPKARSMS